MAITIPEGEAFLPGRGRDEAIAALKAAEAAGLEPGAVRTVQGGYLVPEALLEYYDGPSKPESAAVDVEDADGEAPGPDADADGAAVGSGENVNDSAQPGGSDGETLAQSAVASREAEAAPVESKPPAKSASKGDWVAFAVTQGLAEEEAQALTQAELIERFGAK